MYVLGLSSFYHDSAAALLLNGEIIAAAQEERFTRKKHDSRFPENAILYCLKEAGISLSEVSAVVFYDKPFIKFERLIETYLSYAPAGISSFLKAMPVWLKDKLYLKKILKKELSLLSSLKERDLPKILFTEHHQSHAASAFYPSPFKKAAVLCLDGVGEWATSSVWIGSNNQLTPLWEINFPHSLGMLYSAFTYYTGFKVNSGEYKLMGLAPYGQPKYVNEILDHLIDLKEDGTFRLNMSYFSFANGLTMTNKKFDQLFGGPPRTAEGTLTQKDMDLARSIQHVTEEVVLRLGRSIHKETKQDYLCMAGGVALNCVANGRLLREGPFKEIWVQPAAGDAGGALGAALSAWYQYYNKERNLNSHDLDFMKGSYLGPSFDTKDIEESLVKQKANYEHVEDENIFFDKVAQVLADGNIVGWFQGRMEFGPRALGARSIIGDPRNQKMQSVMNIKIKYRESFRPFAPALLEEEVSEYFEFNARSPYMLMVAPVKESLRIKMTEEQEKLFGIEKLNIPRSSMPAITHVDYSARLQTVNKKTNSRFFKLLTHFKAITGCPVLVNTSFNVRGEPLVCSIEDAYRCFMRTEMDYLIIENFILAKGTQPKWEESSDWKSEYELD
jgi:carbamoyltransferase